MKRLHLLLPALLLALSVPTAAQPVEESAVRGVEVTYLGNEGFLLTSGNTKVLIDALYGNGISGYPKVPAAIREDVESARGRFAGVDLVLASHFHGDHFDASAVLRHLRSNPGARFASTEQAVGKLREIEGFAEVAERVTALAPGEGEEVDLTHAGIRVTALHFHHGRGRTRPTQNLGLLLEVGGTRFIHLGDTEAVLADVAAYHLAERAVDVAMLPYWLLLYDKWKPMIKAFAVPQTIAMHLPVPDAPKNYFDVGGNHAGLVEALRTAGYWVPVEALDSRQYGKDAP